MAYGSICRLKIDQRYSIGQIAGWKLRKSPMNTIFAPFEKTLTAFDMNKKMPIMQIAGRQEKRQT